MRAVVAGSKKGWLTKLIPFLQTYGIEVVGHWEEMNDPPRRGTYGADLVLITKDCNSHSLLRNTQVAARKAGIRCLTITHRMAENERLLAVYGLSRQAATAHYKAPVASGASGALADPDQGSTGKKGKRAQGGKQALNRRLSS
jgi:hypothetical protein